MLCFIRIIWNVAVAAILASICCISHFRTGRGSYNWIILVFGLIRIITDIWMVAILTIICGKSHSCTSRLRYCFGIGVSCRQFKNSAAAFALLRFGTGSSLSGCMSCRWNCLYHLFITMFTVVFHNALALAGRISYSVSLVPFMTARLGVIADIGIITISALVCGKAFCFTSGRGYCRSVIVFCKWR